MNFLAHFHLAWPEEGLIAGGLEGDYFKGPLPGTLPPRLERGVRLHRQIDAYTDAHPLVKELRGVLPTSLRRYAGILIDLCFDLSVFGDAGWWSGHWVPPRIWLISVQMVRPRCNPLQIC